MLIGTFYMHFPTGRTVQIMTIGALYKSRGTLVDRDVFHWESIQQEDLGYSIYGIDTGPANG